MRGMGQYSTDSGTGIDTSPVYVPIQTLPLSTSAPILPPVSAIPCETGQTCSYFANIPDWTLYAAGIVAALTLFLVARNT